MPRHPSPSPSFQATPSYLLTVVLSWLIPGAGHWILGYRARATVIAVTLIGTFWVGENALGGNMAVTQTVHPIFFGLQAGNGLSTFLADSLWGEPVHDQDNKSIKEDMPDHLQLGILFCTISGLLNYLVILHVLDPRTWARAARGKAP